MFVLHFAFNKKMYNKRRRKANKFLSPLICAMLVVYNVAELNFIVFIQYKV